MDDRQATCEQRIADHWQGRRETFERLSTGAGAQFPYFEGDAEKVDAEALADELGCSVDHVRKQLADEAGRDWLAEEMADRLREMPLAVTANTVFRVDLSTGGPGDWLEVFCSGDTPCYEMAEGDGAHYEIERVVYHFNDWFDHAERTLDGEDLEVAERFAQTVIPELIG